MHPFVYSSFPLCCYLFSQHHLWKTPCHPKRKGTSVHSCKQSKTKGNPNVITDCLENSEQRISQFVHTRFEWAPFPLMVCKSPLSIIKMIFIEENTIHYPSEKQMSHWNILHVYNWWAVLLESWVVRSCWGGQVLLVMIFVKNIYPQLSKTSYLFIVLIPQTSKYHLIW